MLHKKRLYFSLLQTEKILSSGTKPRPVPDPSFHSRSLFQPFSFGLLRIATKHVRRNFHFKSHCAQQRGERTVMSSTPDEITIEYEESGQILIKELDKVILSKGAWTTILFRYQELDAETGEYRQKSKFNISSAEQARKIVDALSGWLADA